MAIEGMPTQPIVVFWSGDIAIVCRDCPIMKNNTQHLKLYMILDEYTKWRYGIDTRDVKEGGDLNYNMSEFGVYIKSYPAEYIEKLSGNPENPVMFAFCNFDGTLTSLNKLAMAKETIEKLKDIISTLRSENKAIRIKMHEQSENISGSQGGDF